MHYRDIPQFTRDASYAVDVTLDYIEDAIQRYQKDYGLDLNPDFQREHVWTEKQQIAYVEFLLRGGRSSRDIYFNHPGWMRSMKGNMVLVDGKQRLQAVHRFLTNEIPAFGTLYKNFEGRPGLITLKFHVNTLQTREEVLQWYIDMNAGGTPHTDEEIEKVRQMMKPV